MKKRPKKKKRPYLKPTIKSSEAFYTRALACNKATVDEGCTADEPAFS